MSKRFWTLVSMMMVSSGVAALAHSQELYALERNGGALRVVDRLTGGDIATISTTVAGQWRGMATDPVSGTTWVGDTATLHILDTSTGATTPVGAFGVAIRDLTVDQEGRLWGVAGGSGTGSNSLFAIDTVTGAATLELVLDGGGGHGIAADPDSPGVLYHQAAGVFERVDVGAGTITSVGLGGDAIIGRPLGLVFDPLAGVFRFFDDDGRLYSVSRDGTVAAGAVNPTVYFGLAFDQRTTAVVLFRDGFETGDTSEWDAVLP